jgi:hypothetical protein
VVVETVCADCWRLPEVYGAELARPGKNPQIDPRHHAEIQDLLKTLHDIDQRSCQRNQFSLSIRHHFPVGKALQVVMRGPPLLISW